MRKMGEHPLVISIWLDESERESTDSAVYRWSDLDEVN